MPNSGIMNETQQENKQNVMNPSAAALGKRSHDVHAFSVKLKIISHY